MSSSDILLQLVERLCAEIEATELQRQRIEEMALQAPARLAVKYADDLSAADLELLGSFNEEEVPQD